MQWERQSLKKASILKSKNESKGIHNKTRGEESKFGRNRSPGIQSDCPLVQQAIYGATKCLHMDLALPPQAVLWERTQMRNGFALVSCCSAFAGVANGVTLPLCNGWCANGFTCLRQFSYRALQPSSTIKEICLL